MRLYARLGHHEKCHCRRSEMSLITNRNEEAMPGVVCTSAMAETERITQPEDKAHDWGSEEMLGEP